MTATSSSNFNHSAKRTIDMEAQAVAALGERIGEDFDAACQLLLECKGRVIVTGMGKSGHIARKIAATLASTGTPSHFVHPGEASHGDMGMITVGDAVIALSNSGEVSEVVTLLPLLKRIGSRLIAMTGNPNSTLAKAADAHLDTGVETEACPLDLTPTSSTTTALVMGDALAIALLEARGFTAEDFAFSHPGGTLGKKLLLKVEDIMRSGDAIPTVTAETPLSSALLEISSKRLGMTTVTDGDGTLLGIFTDGDLRRTLDQRVDINGTPISELMTTGAKTASPQMLAAEALRIMEENEITSLVVVDDRGDTCGVIHLMHLLHAGIA
ncbi:KpsF/GutQ family sugar-phosphate isomerase [Pseudohalioglobus lutimaris]|uniref:Arabinose 5-phosphate isomerase n=1 Tax=Pseudohalioglobus lutimaris TaxID=1737061 RepID=A0A2N5X674_9GAMM|nr:KpsF/GutQ family sugar-phosphate isomerase [Pseudohalioglobus lutimaris]PLW69986.1 D-arabinose 5-phosphate isomerase [Pseudohalioglobus lutimaris]